MDRSALLKKVIMMVLTILVIAYVIYVICRASFTQVKTITARESIAYNSITTDCYIVRDETLIEYGGSGVISYIVEDGDKVSVNEAVAGVFDNADAAGTKQEIAHLKAQISSLTMLQKNADALSQSPDELDKAIGSGLVQANAALCSGRIADADASAADVLYYINERQLVTGKATDYNDRINELTARLNELEKLSTKQKKGTDIKAPVTGYFVSSADGYENLITTRQLDELMPGDADFDKLSAKTVSDKVIGKTINGVYWYAVCNVSAEDALKIKNAGSLRLDMPTVSAEKIRVELYALNQRNKSSDAVAVFRGTYMSDAMASLRKGEVSVILNEYTGISIPKSAVHELEVTRKYTDDKGNKQEETKTVTGVFVRMGNEVSFREIFPIFSGESIVISSMDSDLRPFSDEIAKLEAYDEIIVEGANLYDGKIIARAS